MVMAKASVKISTVPASKKPNSNKPAVTTSVNKKSWLVIFIVLVVFPASAFAYNKYLDYKNVQDMKNLLSDFQNLEKAIEEKTGEEFTINANCGSVGKFPTSYACNVFLRPNTLVVTEEIAREFDKARFTGENIICDRYSNIGYKVSEAEDYFGCRALHVRNSNESMAEQIFYNYDESPGSPF
jgi:hypothetical protein